MADADALRASHGQLPAVLLSKSSILIAVDQAGVVLLWNTGAERTFGTPESEVLGHPFNRSGIAWDWARIERLAPGGVSPRAQRIVQPFTRRNGTSGVVALQANPQFNTANQVTGCLWLGSDTGQSGVAGTAPPRQSTAPIRTPLPEPPAAPSAPDPGRQFPVHLSFLESHLVSHGEDPALWRITAAEETRLDEQGMEVLFTLARRPPGRGGMQRRVLVASGELIGVGEQ